MKRLGKLLGDYVGLLNVCGTLIASRWMLNVLFHFPLICRKRDLQPADKAMGDGPFPIKLKRYGCSFKIMGPQALSGIREMYVRDVYLGNGWLRIKPNDTVLDLGANMGNFTNMALAVAPTVRVIAVEPSINLNNAFSISVGLNAGHLARTTLIRGFLGRPNRKIEAAVTGDANYAGADWITEEQLLERTNIESVDFLKCDIEGGEFGLLTKGSRLLAMTKSLAVEVHSFAGNVPQFMADIESCGFIIGPAQADSAGSVTFLAKRVVQGPVRCK